MKTNRPMLVTAFMVLALSAAPALPVAEKGFDDPARLAQLVREGTPEYLLVDVRTPAEFESGHIPTAINIPVDEIGTRIAAVERETLIIVYCRSGNRSAAARATLVDLGFTNVVDFGAVSRWEGDLVTVERPV